MAAKRMIGIIVPSFFAHSCNQMLDLLSSRFRENDYQVIVSQTDGEIRQECELLSLFSETADCILIVSMAENYSDLASSISKKVPVIFLHNEPAGCPDTCILESDYSAIYQGIVSCTNRQVSKIAFLCNNIKLSSSQECLRAYRDAAATTESGYDESLVYDISGSMRFSVKSLVDSLIKRDCYAIFSSTHELTMAVVDYLIFYNMNPEHKPIVLLGYGSLDGTLTSLMHIDLIVHPIEQLANLALQQTAYLIDHPDRQKERVYLLKGTLQMHTFYELNP